MSTDIMIAGMVMGELFYHQVFCDHGARRDTMMVIFRMSTLINMVDIAALTNMFAMDHNRYGRHDHRATSDKRVTSRELKVGRPP